jgi:hypothetical protein
LAPRYAISGLIAVKCSASAPGTFIWQRGRQKCLLWVKSWRNGSVRVGPLWSRTYCKRTATLCPPPSRQKGGDTIDRGGNPRCSVGALFQLHAIAHAQKPGANKNYERGGIMKAKSLRLTALLVASGLTFLSSPAGAECWMTCPPGSTATPSPTGVQGATATAEPTLSPEEPTQDKKPEAMAKAAPTPVPAKPKAVPATAGATTEPAALPEERTRAKRSEATAKASPTPVPEKPKAVPTPAAAGPATEPPPVQSTTTAPAPVATQDAVAPSTPAPPHQGNAAFQPAPASSTPAPVPIPGLVPGTDTMHVIPE